MIRPAQYGFLAGAAALLALSGCSSAPSPAPEKKAETKVAPAPVSGQTAIFEIYKAARQWASDVQVLELEAINLDSVPSQPGKAGAWRALLVSPSKRTKREFTYSVVEESATLHKDVFAQREEPYMKNPQINSFAIQEVRVDTTAALETARKQPAAAEFEKKNPDSPMTYRLEWTVQTPQPAWRVVWGRSVATSGFSVYISAVDGKFLKRAQ